MDKSWPNKVEIELGGMDKIGFVGGSYDIRKEIDKSLAGKEDYLGNGVSDKVLEEVWSLTCNKGDEDKVEYGIGGLLGEEKENVSYELEEWVGILGEIGIGLMDGFCTICDCCKSILIRISSIVLISLGLRGVGET